MKAALSLAALAANAAADTSEIVVAHFSFGDGGADSSFNFQFGAEEGSYLECNKQADASDEYRTQNRNKCESKFDVTDVLVEGDLDNDVVNWRKVGGAEGQSYKWDLYVIGECRIEKFNGNMAWHVTNSAERTIKTGCSIKTKELFKIPQRYSQCKFSMLVRDVDYHGAEKDSEDKMCIKVLNNKDEPIEFQVDGSGYSEICARDDHKFDVKVDAFANDDAWNPSRRLAGIDRNTPQAFNDRFESNVDHLGLTKNQACYCFVFGGIIVHL
jgi:hypothetical protein